MTARWRATALTAVLVLLPLTGCQARAGTAAFIGSTRISDDQVRQVAQEGLAVKAIAQTSAANVAGYRQLILGRLAKHVVVAGAARRLGVSVSEGQIDAVVNADIARFGGRPQLLAALAAAPLKLPPSQLRPFLRDDLLLTRIGGRLPSSQPVTEAEAKQFYDANAAQSGQTFAQLRTQVIAAIQLQRAQQRAQQYVAAYLRRITIVTNPRYGRFDRSRLFDRTEAPIVVATRDALVRDTPATLG